MNKVILSLSAIMLLALSACGGASTAAKTPTTPTLAAGTAVTLTGTVANGTSAGGVAVGAVAAGTGATAVKGYYPGAIVIATDKNGNTVTTTADNAGKFTLNLQAGTSYGLIFINPKMLKVLGSLVQANAQTTAGAIALNGNGNLGTVVINPTTGHAVSSNEATGQLTKISVLSAKTSGLQTNANGTISPTNIANMQATAAKNNPAALKTISAFDYFAKAGTWWSRKDVWTQGNGYSYNLGVADYANVKGPNGGPVKAVKESSVNYYQSSTWNGVTTTGYYIPPAQGQVNGPYGSLTYNAPPATFDFYTGPFTWDYFSYNDTKNNQIYDGSRSWGQNGLSSTITWSKSVSSTIKLGTPVKGAYSDPMGKGSFTVTITLAKENGAAYVLTDANGVQRPVMVLDMVDTFTPNQATCANNGPNGCAVSTQKSRQYMVFGYGSVQVDAGTVANPILPSAALKNAVFGDIKTKADGTFLSATNVNPLATTPALLTNVERDQYLAYVWNNRNKIGIQSKNTTGQTTTAPATAAQVVNPWFGMNLMPNGALVSPTSYNATTGLPNILTAGAAQQFKANIIYESNASVNFVFEVRAFATGVNAKVLASTAPVQMAANVGPTPTPLAATVTLPTMAQLPAASKWTLPNLTNPALAGTTQGNVELWLVMKNLAGAKLFEQQLDLLTVQ